MALNKIKGTINARTTSNCGSAKCQLPVTNEGIQCDTCDMWFHSRCSKLAKLALKLYTDHKFLKWVCTNCTTTIRKSHVNKHTNPGKATTSKSRYSDVAASLSASDVYVSSQKSTESNKPNCSPLSSVGDAPLSPLPEPGSSNSARTSPAHTQVGIVDGVLLTSSEFNPVNPSAKNPVTLGTGNCLTPSLVAVTDRGIQTARAAQVHKKPMKKPSGGKRKLSGSVTRSPPQTHQVPAPQAPTFVPPPKFKGEGSRPSRLLRSPPTNLKPPKHSGTYAQNLQEVLDTVNTRLSSQVSLINTMWQEVSCFRDDLRKLRTESDLALGRHRNVVIRGVPEPFNKNSKARLRDMKHYVLNYLRLVGLSDQVGIKRTLRLGKWKGPAEEGLPRPMLVEFSNPRQRDCFLASALKLREATNGQVIVDPDDKSLKLQSKASATFTASPTNMAAAVLAVPQTQVPQAPIRATPPKNGQVARD